MSDGHIDTAPILVLGIGNQLLTDDGVGMALLEDLRESLPNTAEVEFMDGGTQGLALLGRLENRRALVILDAISYGAEPGTVHSLTGAELLGGPATAQTAHETGARELLQAAVLTGDLPEHVYVIGIEPAKLNTSIGLSSAVKQNVPEAANRAKQQIQRLLERETGIRS